MDMFIFYKYILSLSLSLYFVKEDYAEEMRLVLIESLLEQNSNNFIYRILFNVLNKYHILRRIKVSDNWDFISWFESIRVLKIKDFFFIILTGH